MACGYDIIVRGGRGMNCKNCKVPMYERKSRRSTEATVIYICPKCGNIIYVWPDGEEKEEQNK